MTEAEMQDVAEHSLGHLRASVRRELAVLADHLRPDERLLAMAVGSPGLLTGGATMIAATDQRLLAVGASSGCEPIEYDAVVSVTDDLANHELALVTPDRVLTLTVIPTPGTTELVSAITARIGEDRRHERAGGAEYRRFQIAFARTVLCALTIGGVYLLGIWVDSLVDGWREDRRTPDRLERGACLQIGGRLTACDSDGALFVILGPDDMRRCPSSSPILVRSIASTDAARRELSRWCVDVNTPER